MKKAIIIFVVLIITLVLVLYTLSFENWNQIEIMRGNELIKNIENHILKTGEIPSSNNWETLEAIGFKKDELEKAYPKFTKLNESSFELVYVIGFDPPYIMWNSEERIWKEGFPSTPEDWK